MKLNKMPKEELELLSYTKIAELYLKENKKTMTTATLFKEVCKLLNLSDSIYQDKIADFFQSLTTAKEFILLPDGSWDLKINHSVKIKIDEIYEDEEIDNIENIENIDNEEEQINSEEEENQNFDIDADNDEDYEEDELEDLSILNEEELEE